MLLTLATAAMLVRSLLSWAHASHAPCGSCPELRLGQMRLSPHMHVGQDCVSPPQMQVHLACSDASMLVHARRTERGWRRSCVMERAAGQPRSCSYCPVNAYPMLGTCPAAVSLPLLPHDCLPLELAHGRGWLAATVPAIAWPITIPSNASIPHHHGVSRASWHINRWTCKI